MSSTTLAETTDTKATVMDETKPRTSNSFNAQDADVIIKSSDDVYFHLHKKNIECVARAFPHIETPSGLDNAVCLPETANILEMLFTCIYPRPMPALDELDWNTFMLLAEAAEKYKVFVLTHVCRLHMKDILSPTPSGFPNADPKQKLVLHSKRMLLLKFAAKYEVQDLIEELQVLLVNTPLSHVV
ncbi:hypothetical protein EV361DRAFT_945520 [Lentinula raphanica]|nr:hypothetical protein EV361DRAFT_945520 [Lentinula raphanica]